MPYQRRTFESRIDYSLILPVLMLLSIGVVAIYIAVSHDYPDCLDCGGLLAQLYPHVF